MGTVATTEKKPMNPVKEYYPDFILPPVSKVIEVDTFSDFLTAAKSYESDVRVCLRSEIVLKDLKKIKIECNSSTDKPVQLVLENVIIDGSCKISLLGSNYLFSGLHMRGEGKNYAVILYLIVCRE